MISEHAVTPPGRDAVLRITPLEDEQEILRSQRLVSELRTILNSGFSTGIEHFERMEHLFERLRPEEAVLEPLQLREFIPLLSSSLSLKGLSYHAEEGPLKELIVRLKTHPEILKDIERSIAPDGSINDNASEELFNIRRSINRVSKRIKRALEDILNRPELKPHIQDFYITERNGRWVIPVKSDSKGHIRGVIHDISNTGETVFVEPTQVQHLGNELEALKAEEKLEEFRVLKALSARLREELEQIEEDYRITVEIDKFQAISLFSEKIGALPAELNHEGLIRITGGRHPLLWKTLKRLGQEDHLVPLEFFLGKDKRGMVITGSNAGGKTVTLKTVGVLTLMTLSGLPVPASSGTTIPVLKNVLADIGDEQSIEDNLSTFSAHVTRLREILELSGPDSLVIIDELGTGTDPTEGGALASAILKSLIGKGSLVVVSTHLSMLKALAFQEPLLINAAMEMKQTIEKGQVRYRPSYRLRIGEAGSSHALSIAERLGMPEAIIKEAGQYLQEGSGRLEQLINSLKKTQEQLNRELERVEGLKEELNRLKEELKEKQEELKRKRDNTMKRAYEEAETLLRKIKTEAYNHLEMIKRQKKERAKEHLKRLQKMHEEARRRLQTKSQEGFSTAPEPGTEVKIKNLNLSGKFLAFNKKTGRCRVLVRGREVETRLDELLPVKVEGTEGFEPETVREKEEFTLPTRELNLIGYRVDPALSELERFLNDASLSELQEVKVIHGIGTGILSRAIRDYLKEHPLVEGFRAGTREEGGEGVTVVRLR